MSVAGDSLLSIITSLLSIGQSIISLEAQVKKDKEALAYISDLKKARKNILKDLEKYVKASRELTAWKELHDISTQLRSILRPALGMRSAYVFVEDFQKKWDKSRKVIKNEIVDVKVDTNSNNLKTAIETILNADGVSGKAKKLYEDYSDIITNLTQLDEKKEKPWYFLIVDKLNELEKALEEEKSNNSLPKKEESQEVSKNIKTIFTGLGKLISIIDGLNKIANDNILKYIEKNNIIMLNVKTELDKVK